MEQLELFNSETKVDEENLHEVDYIFIKEGDKYRMEHSFYRDSRVGQLITAEELIEIIEFQNEWHHYASVVIQKPGFRDLFLKKRTH